MFVDLFNEQIERHMLIIPLSRESQLHSHTAAIGGGGVNEKVGVLWEYVVGILRPAPDAET